MRVVLQCRQGDAPHCVVVRDDVLAPRVVVYPGRHLRIYKPNALLLLKYLVREPDLAKAWEWYHKAADQGHAGAQNSIAAIQQHESEQMRPAAAAADAGGVDGAKKIIFFNF